jgi:hypothetical protein
MLHTGWRQPPPRFSDSCMSPRLALRKVPKGTRIWVEVSQYRAFEDGEQTGHSCSFHDRPDLKRPNTAHEGHSLAVKERSACSTASESPPPVSDVHDESLLWLCDLARDYESSPAPAALPMQLPPLNLNFLETPAAADHDLESLATLLGESDLGSPPHDVASSQCFENLADSGPTGPVTAAPCSDHPCGSTRISEVHDLLMVLGTPTDTCQRSQRRALPSTVPLKPLKRHLGMEAPPCA